jgi:hypothetical protein
MLLKGIVRAARARIEIARSVGQDAADRQMRKAGRTSWNRADYNLAARTMNRLIRESAEDIAIDETTEGTL